jgi:hypothetical protein
MASASGSWKVSKNSWHVSNSLMAAGKNAGRRYAGPMTVAWGQVTRAEVLRAIQEYDRLGATEFFAEHGFAPTTTYQLVEDGRSYPPKAILGVAYEFATGQRLASGDFEGGKAGAVKVLGELGFTIQHL